MLRLSEVVLLILPLAAFLGWRILGGGRDVPGPVVAASGLSLLATALLLAALGFGWFGVGQLLPRNATYVPARLAPTGQIIGPDGGR